MCEGCGGQALAIHYLYSEKAFDMILLKILTCPVNTNAVSIEWRGHTQRGSVLEHNWSRKRRHRLVLRPVSFTVYIMDLEEQTLSTVITFTDDSELCGLLNTQEEGNKVPDNCEQASTSRDN